MDQLPVENKPLLQRPLGYLIILLAAMLVAAIIIFLRLNYKGTETQSSGYVEGLPKDQVTISFAGVFGRYPLVDIEETSIQANLNVFEGLTIYRNGRLQPGLAESWTNPDNLTWRFKIRSGVKFHSGDELKASDVKYTIEAAKSSKSPTKWMSRDGASKISSVTVIDDRTVELKTSTPQATLLEWLAYVAILSEAQIKKDGLANSVGTGPYKIVTFTEKEVVLDANLDYWGGAPKVKKLVLQANSDTAARVADVESGKVDLTGSTSEVRQTYVEKGFQVKKTRGGSITFLIPDLKSEKTKYINTAKNPLKDQKVRKAIQLSLDPNVILKEAGQVGEPVSQFATEELSGFNRNLAAPTQNINQAKDLLKQAGFEKGFTVTIDTVKSAAKSVEAIQKQLSSVGITVKVNAFTDNVGEVVGKVAGGDFSLAFLGYGPDTFDSLDLINGFFHSKGDLNLNGYSNDVLDKLLDEAEATLDVQKRAEITARAHQEYMEDLPIILLSTRLRFFLAQDDIAFTLAPGGRILGFDISGREKASNTNQ